MAESLGVSTLELDGDLTPLGRKIDQAEAKAKTGAKATGQAFSRDLKRAMVPALAVLGGLGLAAVKSIDAASDLGEQINKTAVVFGKSAPEIHAWGEQTAGAIGISNRAALEAAGTFGNMLVPMGLARAKAADMSRGMVDLAADMASFNNADPSDVLESLRAGLAGETEPLRKFGVFLNEARIKEEALRLGLVKTTKDALPAAAKAQATYSIIMQDTADAQGDFARTSDSVANAQRILRAEVEDLAAQLGMALLPAVQDLLGFALDLVQTIGDNETTFQALVVVVGAFAGAIVLANTSLAIYNAQLLTAIGLSKSLRLAMAVTPWGAAALGAALLVEHLLGQEESAGAAAKAQDDLTNAVRAYQEAIKEGNSAREEASAASRRMERAEIGVKRALLDKIAVEKNAKSTILDRREAELRLLDAQAEMRSAQDANTAAGQKLFAQQQRQINALNNQKVAVQGLANTYQSKYNRATGDGIRLTGRLSMTQDQLRAKLGTGTRVAAEYAGKLRNMANTVEDGNPKLAQAARLAASLSVAWGRVISLPAAREFVARFRIITTVEENRLNNPLHRQHGGPVMAGQSAIVGEDGRELITPLEDIMVIPLGQGQFDTATLPASTSVGRLNAGGPSVVNNWNFPNYRGNTRELIADIRKGVLEHRRGTGGQEPW